QRDILVVEQAGKGAAENWASLNFSPKRAPAEIHLHQLRFSYGDTAGARSGSQRRRAQIFAAPFPACSTHWAAQPDQFSAAPLPAQSPTHSRIRSNIRRSFR